MAPVSTGCGAFLRGNDVILPDSGDLSLPETLDCGQAFRWKRLPDGELFWCGARQGLSHCTNGRGNPHPGRRGGLRGGVAPAISTSTATTGSVKRRLSSDPVLARAVAYAPGVRVLRQEPWEALCSFIISQNNNVPRIKGIVQRLCAAFGEPARGGRPRLPLPERLRRALEPDDLAPIRAGFRARYLVDAARKAASGEVDLPALAHLPLEEARGELRKITGVRGTKVAECALLYGCGRVECVPIDVWVRRVLDRLYPGRPARLRAPRGGARPAVPLPRGAHACPGFLPGEAAQSSDGR